jgi:hypothetical protein
MDEPTRIRTEAELLRTLLGFGLTNVSAVVEWANSQIEAADSADDLMVEISLSSKLRAHEVGNLLADVRGTADRESYLRSLFAYLNEQLERRPSRLEEIAFMLNSMACEEEFAGLPAESYLFMVEDDVHGVWADNEAVRAGLLLALKALSADPNTEPEPQWWAPRPQGIPIGSGASTMDRPSALLLLVLFIVAMFIAAMLKQ